MKVKLRRNIAVQRIAAAVAAVIAVALAIAGTFVFRTGKRPADASFWELLASDHVTLGFIRLAVIALALYGISSVAALAFGGRWMKALSAGGFEADEPKMIDEQVELIADLRVAEDDRDRMKRLLEERLNG